MKPLTTFLAASAAVVAAAAPAAAAPATVAPLHGETAAVRAFGGVEAWSDLDPSDKQWHVMVRSAGQVTRPPIAAAKDPIAVDVGLGADGTPVLAYVRCTDACRVVVAGVDGGAPRTVPGSAGASAPTVWDNRVAWVRGRATVMTSTLTGGNRMVLPGAPRRKCYLPYTGGPRRCERPQNPSVDALELNGSRLALFDTFGLREASGNGTTEVRIESVKGGPQRLVALTAIGESGQTWIGPSWANGRLYFYKSCFGDPSGCVGRRAGAYGYDPARNTYVRAGGSTVLSGFAMDDDGRRAYEATAPHGGGTCGDTGTRPCVLRLTDALAFEPTRSLVRQP
jgi:hypothetical protein